MPTASLSEEKLQGAQTPRIHNAPDYAWSLGDDAALLAYRYGLVLDPWQQLVLTDWMGCTITGKWACRTCGLAVPRQNGKNATIEARELYGMVILGERILHTAHEVETAMKHFKRMQEYFGEKSNDPNAKYPDLNALVKEVRRGNGKEAILLKSGASIEFRARSRKAAVGYSVDLIVYDESQEFTDDALNAVNATNSASQTITGKQHIYIGTPPGPNDNGEIWRRQRRSGLNPETPGRCWHEWSVVGQLGVDFDASDVVLWAFTNPGLGIRIELTTIEDELAAMSEAGFAMQRLGWWGPDDDGTEEAIPLAKWAEHVAPGPADSTRPTALAIDMSHDRLAAVGACWADGDQAHVELVAVDYATDTLAVVETVKGMARRRIPVVIDQLSPAASLAAPLKQRGVRVIMTSSGTDMAKACGYFADEYTAGRITHAGQEQLDMALAGAKRRKIGDAGGWGLDRRDADQNIAPAVAVILARYGAATSKLKSGRGRVASSTRKAVAM